VSTAILLLAHVATVWHFLLKLPYQVAVSMRPPITVRAMEDRQSKPADY
jgi:hypothetical protein